MRDSSVTLTVTLYGSCPRTGVAPRNNTITATTVEIRIDCAPWRSGAYREKVMSLGDDPAGISFLKPHGLCAVLDLAPAGGDECIAPGDSRRGASAVDPNALDPDIDLLRVDLLEAAPHDRLRRGRQTGTH